VTDEYNSTREGVMVPSKLYEEKRRVVMGALQTAQRVD